MAVDANGRFTTSSSGRTVNATFKGRNSPSQTIPTRLRTHPHMGRDLGIGLPIERSEANSDVVRIFRYARNTGDPQREQKHRRAPGEDSYSEIKSSPAITRYRSSRIRALGRKGCAVGASAKVAVTKPNLADGSQNLELEATTKAFPAHKFRCQHGVVF